MPTPKFDRDGYPKVCEKCGKPILLKNEAVFRFNHIGEKLGPHAWHVSCKDV